MRMLVAAARPGCVAAAGLRGALRRTPTPRTASRSRPAFYPLQYVAERVGRRPRRVTNLTQPGASRTTSS